MSYGLPAADNASSLQADMAKGAAEVKAEGEFITVKMDGEYREVTARCPNCPERCSLHQSKDRHENWGPDFGKTLSNFGWQSDGERVFCSKLCKDRYTRARAQHGNQPLPSVERVNDASYAKKFYAANDPAAKTTKK